MRGSGARNRSGLLVMAIMLMDQLNRMGIMRNGPGGRPTVTLLTMGVCIILHFFLPEVAHLLPFSPAIDQVCIHVPSIWYNNDWKRLFTAALFHVDDTHLYYNMVSLLYKGSQLEPSMGSANFAGMLTVLTALSHGILVAGSLIAFQHFDYSGGLRSCAVGISAVLFALKTILNLDPKSPRDSVIYGIRLPTKYVAWAELLIIQLIVPRASFTGHLAGIAAGLVWVYGSRYLGRQQRRVDRDGDYLPPLRPTRFTPTSNTLNAGNTPTYENEMVQLRDMGFFDRRACHQALRVANGDVNIAAANLAANNGAAPAINTGRIPSPTAPAYSPTGYYARR